MRVLFSIASGAVLFVLVLIGTTVFFMLGTRWTEEYLARAKRIFSVGIILAATVVATYWGILLFNFLTLRLMSRMNVHESNVFIAGGIFLVGTMGYSLKKKKKKWFGIVELAFAWFSAVTISLNVNGNITFAQTLGIVGTVYLVTTSLEHYFDGRREEQRAG